MLGFYNYTVILTYLGMLSGFTGIVCASSGNLKGALICLVIAGVCDMFDGKIASTMERTRSLSDLICFGVLPAMIVYVSLSGRLRLIPCALYTLCALIRLAWFNVDEEERQDRESGRRKVYLGLPVTSAAVLFPVLIGLGTKLRWPLHLLLPLVTLLTAAAFLTPFRLKKPTLPAPAGSPVIAEQEEEAETDRLAEAK